MLRNPLSLLNLGVQLADNPESQYYGTAVVNEWKQVRLFESLVYPYRDGDPVDGEIRITITGGWKGEGAAAGFVTGLTLGLAGTAVGPSMTGKHNSIVVISKGANEVGRYSAQVTSKVEWGMTADVQELSAKADALQINRIAFDLANKIRENRESLTSINNN